MHRRIALIAGLLFPLGVASLAMAESTVTLKKSHLCCPSCVKAATKAVESVPGAKAGVDQKADKITITAANDEDAQKAVDALVSSGFYGSVSSGSIKDDAGAPAGNVKSLSVTTHNCCKKCTTKINNVIKSVPGAKGEAEPKNDTFTVTGDYDAAALVKAFNDAGFSVKVAEK
jgi:copper chaperone CopZ